jgi:hypothetical protein
VIHEQQDLSLREIRRRFRGGRDEGEKRAVGSGEDVEAGRAFGDGAKTEDNILIGEDARIPSGVFVPEGDENLRRIFFRIAPLGGTDGVAFAFD